MELPIIVVSFVVGALFILLALPLMYRRVPINILYGFRVSRYVFSDKDIWYQVNTLGGRYLFGSGLVILVLSGLMVLAGHNSPFFYYALLPFTIAFIITSIMYAWYKTLVLTYMLARQKGKRN